MTKMPWLKTIALLGIGVLCSPSFGADQARPGTVNYIEGSAFLDGTPLHDQSVGSTGLGAGQVLSTEAGKAEILLTPGIFLRVGSNSAVRMISPDLAQTKVELLRGRAGVEVDQIFPQNEVQIVDGGVVTQLIKTGYYEFDSNPAEAMVFKGRAEVGVGDGKWEAVKGHHELSLTANGTREKAVDFNSHPKDDTLYNWSSLRSQYLAEANDQIAGDYYGMAGFNPGWYWDPYMWDYTYLGWDPFFSPFGWGWGGLYGGYGYYGGGYYGGRGFRGGRGYYGGRGNGGRGFSGGDHDIGGGHGFSGGGFGGGHGFAGGGGGGRR